MTPNTGPRRMECEMTSARRLATTTTAALILVVLSVGPAYAADGGVVTTPNTFGCASSQSDSAGPTIPALCTRAIPGGIRITPAESSDARRRPNSARDHSLTAFKRGYVSSIGRMGHR